jgi:hypothetical protein
LVCPSALSAAAFECFPVFELVKVFDAAVAAYGDVVSDFFGMVAPVLKFEREAGFVQSQQIS